MRLVVLLSILTISSSSVACTCGEVNKITNSEIKDAAAVFIGTITSVSVDNSSSKKTATFEIIKLLKGELTKSQGTIRTNLDAGSCGLNFKAGQKWYVFAQQSSDNLFAGLCGRSVQRSPKE